MSIKIENLCMEYIALDICMETDVFTLHCL